MGVRFVRHTLRDNNALWVPGRRLVVSDRALRHDLVRPTLAHECSHVEYNDTGGHHPRAEARANLHSALRLVNPALWDDLTSFVADYDEICLELGITRRQFRAYYEHKRRTDASQVRLQHIGNKIYADPRMWAGEWKEQMEVA